MYSSIYLYTKPFFFKLIFFNSKEEFISKWGRSSSSSLPPFSLTWLRSHAWKVLVCFFLSATSKLHVPPIVRAPNSTHATLLEGLQDLTIHVQIYIFLRSLQSCDWTGSALPSIVPNSLKSQIDMLPIQVCCEMENFFNCNNSFQIDAIPSKWLPLTTKAKILGRWSLRVVLIKTTFMLVLS